MPDDHHHLIGLHENQKSWLARTAVITGPKASTYVRGVGLDRQNCPSGTSRAGLLASRPSTTKGFGVQMSQFLILAIKSLWKVDYISRATNIPCNLFFALVP